MHEDLEQCSANVLWRASVLGWNQPRPFQAPMQHRCPPGDVLLMKTDFWMPFYIGDYLRDTMHLTTLQHGAYLLVLMAMWSSASGRINFNEGNLCRITGLTPQQWKENQLVLMQFLTVENGEIFQKRLIAERIRTQHIRQTRARIGALGGRPRKPIGLDDTKNQKVFLRESKTKLTTATATVTSTEPPIVPQGGQEELPIPAVEPNGYTEDFKAFWDCYPRKVGKGKAFKAWRQAKGRPTVDELVSAVNLHRDTEQWKRDGGQFIPHPSTWLNERRWEDDPRIAVKANRGF